MTIRVINTIKAQCWLAYIENVIVWAIVRLCFYWIYIIIKNNCLTLHSVNIEDDGKQFHDKILYLKN